VVREFELEIGASGSSGIAVGSRIIFMREYADGHREEIRTYNVPGPPSQP
jgi:hypothetical protein